MQNNTKVSVKMEVSVPSTILSPEEVQVLRPSEREKYVRGLIKNILSLNENGVMVSEIVNATNLNRITVTKHLEYLVAVREAYKSDRGTGSIYYQNGRLVHSTDRVSVPIGNKVYDFLKLENAEGNFVFIQEKERDELRLTRVKGGIMIKCQDMLGFKAALNKFINLASQRGMEVKT
jgi:predicted transcriptional regulator